MNELPRVKNPRFSRGSSLSLLNHKTKSPRFSQTLNKICAIVLAAGKGKRMNIAGVNKVTHSLLGTPLLARTLQVLQQGSITSIVVVVGYEKESVLRILPENVIVAEQKELLGTGDAVKAALPKIPKETSTVFILYGDDSYFLTTEIIQKLYKKHLALSSAITFLTIEKEDPASLGRIIRDGNGKLIEIVEEKDTTGEQKQIKEINAGCFMIDKKFLEENIDLLKPNNAQHEYYITDIVAIALEKGLDVETVRLGSIPWRGVNTPEELREAKKLFN